MNADALMVVRRLFEISASGDLDSLSEVLDNEVVGRGTRGGLDELRVMHGLDAWVAYVREVEEQWDQFRVEVERLIEAGDLIVAFLREKGEARSGELSVESETAMVFTVRGTKIIEARGYLDRAEALAAAGVQQ